MVKQCGLLAHCNRVPLIAITIRSRLVPQDTNLAEGGMGDEECIKVQ